MFWEINSEIELPADIKNKVKQESDSEIDFITDTNSNYFDDEKFVLEPLRFGKIDNFKF